MVDHIEFLERPEVARTFFWRRPAFFDDMTPADLKARSVDIASTMTTDQLYYQRAWYKQAYTNNIRPFTPFEKSALISLAHEANDLLRAFPNIMSLPWRFCKLSGETENGFPHTMSDIIFLPDGFDMGLKKDKILEILVHEKIHVFQRKFPIATRVLIHEVWNYRLADYMDRHADARNNPDLDGFVYKHKSQGAGFYMAYLANAPPSLDNAKIKTTDGSTNTEQYEHPNERMAYEISKLIVGQELMDEYTAPLMRWMIDHL